MVSRYIGKKKQYYFCFLKINKALSEGLSVAVEPLYYDFEIE